MSADSPAPKILVTMEFTEEVHTPEAVQHVNETFDKVEAFAKSLGLEEPHREEVEVLRDYRR